MKKNYYSPHLRLLDLKTEAGFAVSASAGLPTVGDDWTNNDYE